MGDADARRRLTHSSPKWLTVFALAFTGLASAYMFTLVVPIQSELPRLLDAPREDTAWVVTITLLVAACATPISGRLGDMYGKRRIVLILIGALMLGSVVAALSPTILGVIVGRGLQGLTTGVIPLGIAIMRDVLPPARLGTAVALMSATMGVGGSIGMPVSAFIVEHFDWHALFWVSTLLGAVAFVLVRFLVPSSVLRSPGRFDTLGVIGLTIGLAGILLAISRGADWGWLSPATLASGIGGVVVLLVWGAYQLRTREPLIDLRVTARPVVLYTNLAAICMGFALFGSNVLLPQMLELPVETGSGFGLGVFDTALLVMPSGLIMMVISPLSGWLERTVGPRIMLSAGTAAVALSYVVLADLVELDLAPVRGQHDRRRRHRADLRRDADAHHALGPRRGDGRLQRHQRPRPLARHLERLRGDGGRPRRRHDRLRGRLRPRTGGVRPVLLDRRDRRRRLARARAPDPEHPAAGGPSVRAGPRLSAQPSTKR